MQSELLHNLNTPISSGNRNFITVSFLISVLLISGCAAIKNSHKHELGDGAYLYRQAGNKYQKAFVYLDADTFKIFTEKKGSAPINSIVEKDQFFLKSTFDVDVMTVGFKYRPSAADFPRQLNTDFNGNVFLGYRLDRFRIQYDQTPAGLKNTIIMDSRQVDFSVSVPAPLLHVQRAIVHPMNIPVLFSAEVFQLCLDLITLQSEPGLAGIILRTAIKISGSIRTNPGMD
jgi:hypothetical protein